VLKAVTDLSEAAIDWSGVDLILGIEAMGLPLTAPLSVRTGVPLVIGRKRSYGLDGEVVIDKKLAIRKQPMFLNDIATRRKSRYR